MYKISTDTSGNILNQYITSLPEPAHLEVVDGVTWLESDIRKDVLLHYWTGSAWADKAAKDDEDTIWSVWNGSDWVEDAVLKQSIQLSVLYEMRGERGALLANSDWTQIADSPLTDAKKAEWAAYRVVLRDYPSNNTGHTSFATLVWPSVPA
jgi:hypothetical protein